MRLTISRQHAANLRIWVDAAMPAECCGLLFGDGGRVSAVELTANVAENSARHFEIDPSRLVAAMRAMRGGGPEIIGYFHSHPEGAAQPSACDARAALADGRYWLIVSGDDMRAWMPTDKGSEVSFVEAELVVEG
jgi:desampylase